MNFDELTATTLQEIMPRKAQDWLFKGSPLISYIMAKNRVEFPGGLYTQIPGIKGKTIGGPFAAGGTFTLVKPSILTAMVLRLRLYQQSIVEYLEELLIDNAGPLAILKIVDVHVDTAFRTMTEQHAIDIWRHGQNATLDNRLLRIHGIAEALNDGVSNSWEGNVFTTYGGTTRSTVGANGNGISSVPFFNGDSAGAAAAISYGTLDLQYESCVRGKLEPDLFAAGRAFKSYVKQRIQAQQRFAQEQDPVWGVRSFRFNNAMCLTDDYAPSALFGENDPLTGNYLTSTFTAGAAPAAASGLTANVVTTVGEVGAFLNTATWMLRIAAHPLFQYGSTGWKVAQDSLKIAMQILFGGTFYTVSSRDNKQIYGVNG